MKTKRIRRIIGFGLLGLTLLASFGRVITRNIQAVTSDQIELRIGHMFLYAGMREGLTEAIEGYQKLHPNVKITQVPIPARTFSSWVRIQLIGGNAMDILSTWDSKNDDIRRYFLSLTPFLDEPNPYNVGTSLEGVPWIDTFFDGLNNVRQALNDGGDIYSISLQRVSTLMFINVDLLREITGSDTLLPRDFEDLRKLAAEVRAYNQRTGNRIIPIASCRQYAENAFGLIVPSVTQKLALDHSPDRSMKMGGVDRLILNGTFSFSKTPEFMASLELTAELAQMFTPGFLQFEPQDAISAYTQQRGLMMMGGSWDYGTLTATGNFETLALPLARPSRTDSKYGDFILGTAPEIQFPEGTLGITKSSKHREQAIDFLRYLSSQPVAARLADMSQKLPSIVDAPISEKLQQLLTEEEGEIPGFLPYRSFAANASTFVSKYIHQIIGLRPEIQSFAATLDAELAPYIRQDIDASLRNSKRWIRLADVTVALNLTHPDTLPPPKKTWTHHVESHHTLQYGYLVTRLRYNFSQ